MMRFARLCGWVIVFFLAVGMQSVYAVPTLSLSDGTNSVLIEDGSALDSYPLDGVVTYIGPVGIFNLNVATGLTYPLVGTLGNPQLDLNDVSVSGAGTLTIKFSQTGFGLMKYADFISAVGGVTNGTINVATYLDNTNTLFGMGTELANMGPFHNAFDDTKSMSLSPSDLFSLTTVATITHTGAKQISSFDLALKGSGVVPEPCSFILFATGGAFLAGRRYLRKKKNI